jgi:hypothetical protein
MGAVGGAGAAASSAGHVGFHATWPSLSAASLAAANTRTHQGDDQCQGREMPDIARWQGTLLIARWQGTLLIARWQGTLLIVSANGAGSREPAPLGMRVDELGGAGITRACSLAAVTVLAWCVTPGCGE